MDETARKRTWIDLFEGYASEHPDTVAITLAGEDGETLSWRDLVWRSAGVARLFADRGVKQGDVVCIQLPNTIAFILATMAAWRLGATVSPLRWDLPAPERAQLMALADPTVTITQAGSGEGEISEAEVAGAAPVDPATLPPSVPATPAWMTASGGSTGSPKLIAPDTSTALGEGGMPMTGGRSNFADNSDHRHPVHLVCTPLYHMHGFALLWRTLTEDFRVVVMPRFETEMFLDLIESERVSFIAIVPTMVVRLMKSPTACGRDFSSLQRVIFGAGATPEWAIREWIDVVGGDTLLLGYGMSESIAASFISGTEWLQRPGSVGKPIGVETLVVDEEGEPLPPGEVGELFFRPQGKTEQTFRYVGNAKARSLPGGWASVGDLGRLDEDGYLYIVDRRSDMIKTGGSNVFVSEVEAALLAHPDVADVAVIGLPDPEWTRRVHAIVQLQPGADSGDADQKLRDHCKQLLAAYKAPRSFEFVETLGRSDAGKLNRQALVRAREEENA